MHAVFDLFAWSLAYAGLGGCVRSLQIRKTAFLSSPGAGLPYTPSEINMLFIER